MRLLVLSLFGLYQLGRSSRQQVRRIGRELFTIPESVEVSTSGDSVEKFQADGALSGRWKEIALKQHMELLGIPTEYIRACFVAMMVESEAQSFLSHNKGELSPRSDPGSSFAGKLLFLKQRYGERFERCFTALDDADKRTQALLKLKTAMENQGMSREYIEVCFRAMEADSATDRMKYECVAGLDALFAHQQKLEKFKTVIEKLGESSVAKLMAILERKRKEQAYFDRFQEYLTLNERSAEATDQERVLRQLQNLELLSFGFEFDGIDEQVEESEAAETLLHLKALKAALEDLHIPEIAIQSCLTQMGLGADHVAEVMRIARQESSPEDAAKLNYERTLEKLTEYYGIDEHFDKCLQAIEWEYHA